MYLIERIALHARENGCEYNIHTITSQKSLPPTVPPFFLLDAEPEMPDVVSSQAPEIMHDAACSEQKYKVGRVALIFSLSTICRPAGGLVFQSVGTLVNLTQTHYPPAHAHRSPSAVYGCSTPSPIACSPPRLAGGEKRGRRRRRTSPPACPRCRL
ncbi:MAG: hypothetical protein FE78DRAFT_73007 [Acidomyces sp. 'richmondensis']|nr:MAG: hypothetical protein FE78DRAFT_73007 [Acidomyces sp. 'richmondensis']